MCVYKFVHKKLKNVLICIIGTFFFLFSVLIKFKKQGVFTVIVSDVIKSSISSSTLSHTDCEIVDLISVGSKLVGLCKNNISFMVDANSDVSKRLLRLKKDLSLKVISVNRSSTLTKRISEAENTDIRPLESAYNLRFAKEVYEHSISDNSDSLQDYLKQPR